AADCLQHLAPVEFGQVEVEQHQRRLLVDVATLPLATPEQVVQRIGAVGRHHQAVGDAGLCKRDAGQLGVVRAVLHQQDLAAVHAPSPATGAAGSSTWNTLPPPGPDSARTRPPWRSTITCTIASPSPWPAPCSAGCRRWNGSNMRAA